MKDTLHIVFQDGKPYGVVNLPEKPNGPVHIIAALGYESQKREALANKLPILNPEMLDDMLRSGPVVGKPYPWPGSFEVMEHVKTIKLILPMKEQTPRPEQTDKTVKNTKPALVHSIATCNDCPWLGDDYRSSLAAAKKHVKDTGHSVLIERAYSWYIKPNKLRNQKNHGTKES